MIGKKCCRVSPLVLDLLTLPRFRSLPTVVSCQYCDRVARSSANATRQVKQHLRTHASSLRLALSRHRLAIDTHSLVISIPRHILPRISPPTRLRSPRNASAAVARRLKDGEVAKAPQPRRMRSIVYRLPHSLVRLSLVFLIRSLALFPFTLAFFYSTSRPPFDAFDIEHRRVDLSQARPTSYTFNFHLFPTHPL